MTDTPKDRLTKRRILMGADLDSRGSDKSLNTKDACHMVAGWLDDHYDDKRPFDQQRGSWDFPAEAVLAANATVPVSFAEALETGFVPDYFYQKYPDARQEAWEYARLFLKEAAEAGESISGSF